MFGDAKFWLTAAVLGLAAILWWAAPENALAHGGGGGGGGHGGGGHGGSGGHGGYHGGFYGGRGFGGYGFGGYGLYGLGYPYSFYGWGYPYGYGGWGYQNGYGYGDPGYYGGYYNPAYPRDYDGGPQYDAQPPANQPAHLTVLVPADAQVYFQGTKTRQTGPVREFTSPSLEPGNYSYDIRATWTENGRPRTETRHVAVHPGDEISLRFPHAAAKTAPSHP